MAPRSSLMILFLLVCAFACRIESGSFVELSSHEALLYRLVPERLRGFVAARLWEQADRYMHAGPSRLEQKNFIAGSYAGNTDLLPLLHAVNLLVPHELPPWQLLANNLALHLQQKQEAIRLLQHAIHLNRDNSEIHELYATIASIKMFTGEPDIEQKRSALKYLQQAINRFVFSRRPLDDHSPGLSLPSYFVLRSRLEVELGYPRAALESWQKSGLPLTQDQGRLAAMLMLFRDRGIIPDPLEFKKNSLVPDQPAEHSMPIASKKKIAQPSVYIKPPLYRPRLPLFTALLACLILALTNFFLSRRQS